METLESLIFEETLEQNPLPSESFPMRLEDHELDTLAFELWREGCCAGWATPEEADEP